MDVFQLNELIVFGPVHADDDSLFSHLSKFPPSLGFNNAFSSVPLEGFLHDRHVVNFLRVIQFVLF